VKIDNSGFNPALAGGDIETKTDGYIVLAELNAGFQIQPQNATWDEAAEALKKEKDLLADIASGRASINDNFFDRLFGVRAAEVAEIGVMSVTAALQAAGCFTLSSCRGEGTFDDGGHNESYPCVSFLASRSTANIIKRLATRAEVSIYYARLYDVADTKVIVVSAERKRIDRMISLARLIVEAKDEIDALGDDRLAMSDKAFRKALRSMDPDADSDPELRRSFRNASIAGESLAVSKAKVRKISLSA